MDSPIPGWIVGRRIVTADQGGEIHEKRGLKGRAADDTRPNGVPPAQVAEWAGNSVPVLLATCAGCIAGQLKDLQRRIESGDDLPDTSAGG